MADNITNRNIHFSCSYHVLPVWRTHEKLQGSFTPPCGLLTAPKGNAYPAPSAAQNLSKDLWRLLFFSLTRYRATLAISSSPSLWIPHHVFTKWAVWYCLQGGVLPGQNYQTAAWGGPISLILNAQNQHRRKAQEMPGLQFNVMEMTTEMILTHIPHYIDCTCMANYHCCSH